MRKRRRLANKMTIMVCAVLIAVSAFFYAPMYVEANEENYSDSVKVSLTPNTSRLWNSVSASSLDIATLADLGFDSDYVLLSGRLDYSVVSSQPILMRLLTTRLSVNGKEYPISYVGTPGTNSAVSSYSDYVTFNIVVERSDFYNLDVYFICNSFFSFDSVYEVTVDFHLSNLNLNYISDIEGDSYQIGYDAGFSAGEQAGYGNGYSQGFTDGEASVDTDAIYDEAFQAGKDSVDTQSYYDAGYQAGYQVAYSEGYESGYDVGYQDAMDRIANWGADTSDYPILVFDESFSQPSVYVDCMSNIPGTSYGATSLFHLDFNVNPNHTYKFVFDSEGFYSDTSDCLFGDKDLGYVVGNLRIPASYNTSWGTNTVFIPGDCVSSVVKLDAFVYEMRYYGGVNESNDLDLSFGQVRFGTHGDVSLKVYDMGPSGDTQNHIANQTDQLTNGYDDSKGNTVNSELSTGLNEYETAENSLFATATTGMKDFTFFDFESVPAMITGMSFIGSIMGSWFNQAGGASGVGIVLSILFSVILVAMVLGLYRWYQSRGGKN